MVWEAAIMALLGAAGIWMTVREHRQRLQAWRAAAAACGLRELACSRSLGFWARAGELDVRIESSGEKHSRARITISVPRTHALRGLRIRPEPLIPLPWVREIEIGDPNFDRAFILEGPARPLFSVLDRETRRLLMRLNTESSLEISDCAVQALLAHEKVGEILPLLLEAGRRLARVNDGPQGIAENAGRDPEAGVRLRSLLCLVHELPGHPVTLEALRAAGSDSSAEIRLRAAIELGAEGREALLALAESTTSDGVSAQAVRTLDRDLPLERATAILYQALRRRLVQTALACLEVIGVSGNAEAVGTLVKVMTLETGELALGAAWALGATQSAAAEPPLIAALEREEAGLRVGAANALARLGSVAAVLPLKTAAERFPLDRALRRAARQAIAEIQSRLPGASPGQLSLADHEAGQLSLAEAEAGQLSLAPEQAGKLSLMGPHLPGPPLPQGEEGEKPPGSAGIPAG